MDYLLRPGGVKGLSTRTSLRTRSATLRVTRIKPRALAVAARRPSMTRAGWGRSGAPFLRDASIDVDDVIGVDGPQAVRPLLEQVGLGAVLTAQ
jgi:hypothetical protein